MAMTRFERRVAGYDRDEAALRRDERNVGRMEREQAIRDREADVYNAARRRRLESQNLTALADPGRYAPQVCGRMRGKCLSSRARTNSRSPSRSASE